MREKEKKQEKFGGFKDNSYLCIAFKKGAFSSAGLEHLPYKQRVGGSNPSTPTWGDSLWSQWDCRDFCLKKEIFFRRHDIYHIFNLYLCILIRPQLYIIDDSA